MMELNGTIEISGLGGGIGSLSPDLTLHVPHSFASSQVVSLVSVDLKLTLPLRPCLGSVSQ